MSESGFFVGDYDAEKQKAQRALAYAQALQQQGAENPGNAPGAGMRVGMNSLMGAILAKRANSSLQSVANKQSALDQGRAKLYADALQEKPQDEVNVSPQVAQPGQNANFNYGGPTQPTSNDMIQAIMKGGDPKMIGPALAEALKSSMDRDAKTNEPITPFQKATMDKQAQQFDETRLDTADSRLMQAQQQSNAMDLQRMGVKRQMDAEAEAERHNREMESAPISVAPGNQLLDKKTGKPIGGNGAGDGVDVSTVHGDDFLKTLAPADATEVKAMAEGRLAFPTGMSLSKLQPLIQKVGQYDPTFDAVNYNARSKTRAAFTGAGKEAQNLAALSTAILHAGQLYDQIDNVAGHGGLPGATALNAAQNYLSQSAGKPGVTNYRNNARDLSDEVTRAFRQAGGSEAEISGRLAGLSENLSTADKKNAISGVIDRLMSRTDALGEQYKQGMGTDKVPIQLLSPAAQAQIQKIQAPPGAGQAAASKPPSGVDPNLWAHMTPQERALWK